MSTIITEKTAMGIELGSTRIKAVLTDEKGAVLASGGYTWENKLENGLWTYSLDDIRRGIQGAFSELSSDVKTKYGLKLNKVGAIGVSAMMHGYMAFDESGNLLVPFRTWRNSNTEKAASQLTELFGFNIPERWSVAHLWEAIIDGEEHVGKISYVTTLAGYIHWMLTGRKVLGIGDASGMFPIDSEKLTYDNEKAEIFEMECRKRRFTKKITEIFPQVLAAGTNAGNLTEQGATFIDPTGELKAGIPLCPPEGDAGTGMTATDSVAEKTGNISAGTSIFAMIVLEKKLNRMHREIDMVTTPSGKPCAMVHANNCTSDINAWVKLFEEFSECSGIKMNQNEIFNLLFNKALEGDPDCGGILTYGYYSGEFITGMQEGRPLLVRKPESEFNLANLMRANLFSALGAIRIGMDILFKDENVKADRITGHGGLFKTPIVGQRFMASAIGVPVTCLSTAGEGGPWGMALLALYMMYKENGELLESFLSREIFTGDNGITIQPDSRDSIGFEKFMETYKKGLSIEKAAVENIR
jgi:sugar (pentulose or hexulose) kinase